MEALYGLIGSVVVAIITYLGVVHSSKENNKVMLEQLEARSKEADAKLEKAQAVTDTKLEELTREVRRHNNFAEVIPVIQEQIKAANHRIDDIERKIG